MQLLCLSSVASNEGPIHRKSVSLTWKVNMVKKYCIFNNQLKELPSKKALNIAEKLATRARHGTSYTTLKLLYWNFTIYDAFNEDHYLFGNKKTPMSCVPHVPMCPGFPLFDYLNITRLVFHIIELYGKMLDGSDTVSSSCNIKCCIEEMARRTDQE